MRSRPTYVCAMPKYPCFADAGHETLKDANACFRSERTHNLIAKRDGAESANRRAIRHRLPWRTDARSGKEAE